MTNTEWFASRKWGIFTHCFHFGNDNFIKSRGGPVPEYNEFINNFDTEKFARALNETNCGYLMFTMGQGQKYWCAPNENFNRITGYKTGEACSRRDLIEDLLNALEKYDIPLFLYFTGDGPYADPKAGKAMGFCPDGTIEGRQYITEKFIKNWGSVLREYSLRYGNRVKGWWVDGCYDFFGYTDEFLNELKKCARAGNPDALCAFNNGTENKNYNNPRFAHLINQNDHSITKMEKIEQAFIDGIIDDSGYMNRDIETQWREADDFTAGERTEFSQLPESDNHKRLWHILSFLGQLQSQTSPRPKYLPNGSGWAACGSRYSGDYMRDYVNAVNAKNGIVTIDIAIFDDATFDLGQIEVLKKLKDIRNK